MAALRKEVSVLNGPFPPKLHKKIPKCVSIPGIFLFVYMKDYRYKTALHLKRAIIPYGVPPNAVLLLYS